MSGAVRAAVGHAFRRTALPLVCYYGVTLVIPLANGAAQSATFAEHALVVLVVPPAAIVLACAVHTLTHAFLSARFVFASPYPPRVLCRAQEAEILGACTRNGRRESARHEGQGSERL
jgi:hypothetical protein